MVAAVTVSLPDKALADCVLNGSTVTCAPPGTGGFTAASDGLNVTVQSGATASTTTPAAAAITINNTSTLLNDGTISAVNTGAGIAATNFNRITNNGAINVGDNATGIFAGDGNTITNNGTISSTSSGIGIGVNASNTVYNYGTISTGQFGTAGVQFGSTNNTFYNYGTVRALDGTSVEACGCGATGNTVNNYGTLDGTLQMLSGSSVINNYGLITMTGDDGAVGSTQHYVNGTFNQFAGGILELRVNALGVADTLAAGTLNLAGTLRLAVRPGLYGASTTYNFVVENLTGLPTITSTFTSIVSSSPFFAVTPIYDTSNPAAWAGLSTQLDRIPFGSVPGATDNQRAVGNVLEPGYSTSLTGSLATFYSNLLAATSLTALDQLSGAGTAAAQNSSFGATGLFSDAMMQQGLAWLAGAGGGGFGAPLQYAAADKTGSKPGYEAFAAMQPRQPQPPVWRAWALGFGSTRSIDGNASLGTADQSLQTAGGALGVERAFGGDLLLGLAAGGSGSRFSAASLSTNGTVDGGHIGGYAVTRWGDMYAAATLNYARFDNRTDRTIAGIGTTETAHGSFASDEVAGRFELGWRRRMAGYSVTPFVAVEPAALWQHAYSESSTTVSGGAGTLGLSYAARETTSLPTFVGAQLDGQYLVGGQTVRPFVRAAWVHEFMPQRQIEATFISIPAASFTVDGTRPASDAARISGGATWTIDASKALFARVDTEFSGSSTMVAGTAGARVTW